MAGELWKKALSIPRLSNDRAARKYLLEKIRLFLHERNEREPDDIERWETRRLWARFYEIAEPRARAKYPELFKESTLNF